MISPQHASKPPDWPSINLDLNRTLAAWLCSLLPPGRPRRVSLMTGRVDPKYRDLPKNQPFTDTMLAAHSAGTATYATTVDRNTQARVGVIDIDSGGVAALQDMLARLAQAGLAAFAIAVTTPGGHVGGHIWVIYRDWCNASDICAQLTALAPVKAEIWPSNQAIRLPFGVHRLALTRGQLLTQAGDRFDLDEPAQLVIAVQLVQQLPANGAPPRLASIRPSLHDIPIAPIQAQHTSGRLQARATIDAFNATHPLEQVLARYGAHPTHDGFSCPCGIPHTHATTLVISSRGRLFSFSPRCRWYTAKGLDSFGLFCLVEHAGNTIAALKAMTPASVQSRAPEDAAARARAAQRKRVAHAQQMAAVRALVEARARTDEQLSVRAQIVLQLLLNVAGNRDWCRPGIAALARLAAGLREQGRPYSERTVQLAMAELVQAGYISSAGQGGRPYDTAIRRFLPQPADDSTGAIDLVQEACCCTHDQNLTLENQAQRACEPGATMTAGTGSDVSTGAMLPATTLDCEIAVPSELIQGAADSTGAIDLVQETDPCAPDQNREHENHPQRSCEPGATMTAGTESDDSTGAIELVKISWYCTHDQDLEHESLPERACEPRPEVPSLAPAAAGARRSPAPEPDEPEPLHGPDGAIAYPNGAAWLPTEAAQAWWEALQREQQPPSVPEVRIDLDPPPAAGPVLPTAQRRAPPDRLAGYRAQLARMDTTQLAGERRKHERTLQKFPSAHWLADIHAKLRLVHELLNQRRPAPRPTRSTRPTAHISNLVVEQLGLFEGCVDRSSQPSPGMIGVAQARASPIRRQGAYPTMRG